MQHDVVPEARDPGGMWVDLATRTRESVGFFGPARDQLFGVLHQPEGEAIGGLVIASPVHAELVKNHRREVLLARSLASHGVAVQRFHYRGAGNSDGQAGDLTFDSMLEDLEAAVAELASLTGIEQPLLFGTRLGALAVLAVNHSRGPVALWEPVVDPPRYFREIGRGGLMRAAAGRGERPPPLVEELRRGGSIDILGYELTRGLFDSCTLTADAAPVPRSAFIVQLRRRSAIGDDYLQVIQSWKAQGADVDALAVATGGAWWFEEDIQRGDWTYESSRPYIDATVEWIVRALSAARLS